MRHLFFLLCCLPGLALASDRVHEFHLDNGMKLLVKEDHRAPIVVSQVWYKVGGSYEHNGITGVSHVLEHMMFKGTEKYGPGEFSKVIARHGGRENAFTGRDYTAYFQTLEKSRLHVSFEMEADRMRNLTLPEAEFVKEIEVVKEERRMRTEDDPRALTYEQFNAVAYTNSPYKNPIIGWMNDLDNMSVADLRKWYERYYTPANATLVVVGDVEPREVHALANKYFGQLPAGAAPTSKPRIEAEPLGPRRITVRAPAKVPYIMLGYKVPVLHSVEEEWEAYALEVLAGVLSAGRSSRFRRELIRDTQIAADADAGYNMFSLHNEMFLVDGTPANGHTIDELEKALHAQIERIRNEPVTMAELDRIKAQVIAGDVYEKDSAFYQGMILGTLETVGLGWQKADEYLAKVKAVTPEQIQAVAKKYLVEDRLTVAVLDPQPLDSARARRPAVAVPAH